MKETETCRVCGIEFEPKTGGTIGRARINKKTKKYIVVELRVCNKCYNKYEKCYNKYEKWAKKQ